MDPGIHILAQRILACRRAWYATPEVRPHLEEARRALEVAGHPGTKKATLSLAFPVEWDEALATRWPHEGSCHGPVALLLQSCVRYGLVVDQDWCVHTVGGQSFSLLQGPYQHLKPIVIE
eukprot:10845393-Alexandrium_andersonii.AAC.1